MKLLILRTAPLEQMALCLSKIREADAVSFVECVCQSTAVEAIDKAALRIDDFIAYDRPFMKLYYLFGVLREVKKEKYGAIAFFYNNIPRKGYQHVEWFAFLTGIKKIFLCDENGEVEVLSRRKFLNNQILGHYFRYLGNVITFFAVFGFLFLIGLYRLFRNIFKRKKL